MLKQRNVIMNLNVALTFARYDDTQRFRIVFTNRFNETRVVSHLTYADAMHRADVMRKRAYRVEIKPMCSI